MKMGSFNVNANFSTEIKDDADLISLEKFVSEAFKEFIQKVTSKGFELTVSAFHSSSWDKYLK